MNADERMICILTPLSLLTTVGITTAVVTHYRLGRHGDPGLALIVFGVVAAIVLSSIYLVSVARRAHVRRSVAFIAIIPFMMLLGLAVFLIAGIASTP